MKKFLPGLITLFGLLLASLGGLWALQGADLVHLKPIACVADCEPLEGFSAIWLAVGALTCLAGLAIAWWSARKLLHPRN